MLDMERKEREIEIAGRKQLENNREILKTVAKKADEPVDIDDIVEGIFGFLPTDPGSDAPPPTAFSVICTFLDISFSLPGLYNLPYLILFQFLAILEQTDWRIHYVLLESKTVLALMSSCYDES